MFSLRNFIKIFCRLWNILVEEEMYNSLNWQNNNYIAEACWCNLKTTQSDPIFLKYKILKINDKEDFNKATSMFKNQNGLLLGSLDNIFNKLQNLERSLSCQVDLLDFSSLQTFPSYSLYLKFGITFLLN